MRTLRTLLKTLFLLIPFILCPASDAWSLPPEDLEASGDDLDLDMEGSGSGAGGGPPTVILDEKSTPLGSSKDDTVLTNDYKSTKNVFKEVDPWDREPTIVQESKSFMESKEVLAGVIAGGVGGLVLAVLLGGLLIYRWQKKDTSGYTQGHRQEQYHTPQGQNVVLV